MAGLGRAPVIRRTEHRMRACTAKVKDFTCIHFFSLPVGLVPEVCCSQPARPQAVRLGGGGWPQAVEWCGHQLQGRVAGQCARDQSKMAQRRSCEWRSLALLLTMWLVRVPRMCVLQGVCGLRLGLKCFNRSAR